MTRQIKFRAWNTEVKKMTDNFHLSDKFTPALQDTVDWKHLEIMQFTGLLGKLGVEIYEGDVVEYNTGNFGGMATVLYIPTGFFLENTGFLLGDNDLVSLRVIGNIYENPELIS